jgi:P27 family predicted phage terminase small subunit
MPNPSKTPEQHQLNGTEPKPSRARSSKLVAGQPVAPKWLDKTARQEFARMLPLLEQRDSLTPADYMQLAIYASAVSRYVAALKDVDERGPVVTVTTLDKHGAQVENEKTNPSLRTVAEAEKAIHRYLRELGATPRTREGVKPAKKSTKGKSLLEQLAERGIN